MPDPVRLAKCVAELMRCSRLEAEQYVKGGWVSVDGPVVEDPAHLVSSKVVAIDPAAQLEIVPVPFVLACIPRSRALSHRHFQTGFPNSSRNFSKLPDDRDSAL
jgi:hypothetical protein